MALSGFKRFKNCLTQNVRGEYTASYAGYHLRSVFQPIFNARQQIIGAEALLRLRDPDGKEVRPDTFFHTQLYPAKLRVAIEALSRTMHILNFSQSHYRELKLFLNVLPEPAQNLLHEEQDNSICEYLQRLNLNSHQLVMEFVELEVREADLLSRIQTLVHNNGCEIAVDDYGSRASNEERVQLLCPEIVKIDRRLLNRFMLGDRHPLLSALKTAGNAGAKTVIEGIESKEQFDLMAALKIDMFQGYHLARPAPLGPGIATPSRQIA